MIDLQSYVGHRDYQTDRADAQRMAGLAALLDHDKSPWREGMLPPLGHWLCFHPQVRQSLIGPDGHPARTHHGLLPAVELPRRMWAGSRIRFLDTIPLDTPIERTSTVLAVTPKSGRSGDMLFVTICHEIGPKGAAAAIIDEQDIVYRAAPLPGAPVARPSTDPGALEKIARTIVADTVTLFRYSALTFNGHRIHYDRAYARDVESYPGLVVHGPLIATLMLDHLLRERPHAHIGAYSFRALAPIFDGEPIRLGMIETKDGAALRAITANGVAMTATAEFAK